MPALIPLAIAAATAGGKIVASKMESNAATKGAQLQSDATTNAAKLQTDAQNHAADIQGHSADETLAFQKSQAAQDAARFEAAQRGNYGQYVSKVHGAQALGDTIGFHLPDAAPYVSATDGSGPSGPGGQSGGTSDPKISAFIADWQKSHAPSEGIAPLADAIAKQFPGVSRFMYGQTPSNNELSIAGQKYKVLGGENTPGAYWYQPGMNDAPASGGATMPNSISAFLGAAGAGGTPAPGYTQYAPQVQPFKLRSINAFLQ